MNPQSITELLQLIEYASERRYANDITGYQLATREIKARLESIPQPVEAKPQEEP